MLMNGLLEGVSEEVAWNVLPNILHNFLEKYKAHWSELCRMTKKSSLQGVDTELEH